MDRADFAKFFAAVNGGYSPFRWQERLLDTVLGNGRWPDRIAAPTGQARHRRSTSTSSPWHSPPAVPPATAPPRDGGGPEGHRR